MWQHSIEDACCSLPLLIWFNLRGNKVVYEFKFDTLGLHFYLQIGRGHGLFLFVSEFPNRFLFSNNDLIHND